MKKKLVVLLLSVVMILECLVLGGCGSKKPTLTVFNYGNYIDPDVIKMFEKEYGVKVKYEEATTPEILYSKYKAGSIKYDVVCTSDYMLQRLINENELVAFNRDNMQYIDNIGDTYWGLAKNFDANNQFIIPYFYGTIGIMYDKTKVDGGELTSWSAIFDKKYDGEIIMMNSVRDAYMVAMCYLGYDINSTNKDEIKEAHKLLLDQKKLVQAYLVDETKDEIIAGNATMGVIYSGDAVWGIEESGNPNLAFAVPEEGTNLWIDCWGITKQCDNQDLAEKWLDFLMREDVAQMNFDYIYYSTPNVKVIEAMDEEIRNDENYVPTQEILDRSQLNTTCDEDMLDYYNELWKELKSK